LLAGLLAALSLAPGAGLAFGGPKRPPVPSFWAPFYPHWSTVLEASPIGPPAFDKTHAYVGLRDGWLVAVALATGAVVWSVEAGVTTAPAATDGLVVAVSEATLFAFDGASGEARWQQSLGAPGALAPVAGPGWIAVVTTTPELIVLRPGDGRVLWRQALAAAARALPVGDADRIIVGLTGGRVVAMSVKAGTLEWTRTISGTPLVLTLIKDRLFVGSSDDFLWAIGPEGGGLKWRWRTGGDVGGTVAADTNRVYFASLDNSMVALGRGGGDQKWEQRLPSRPVGGPVLAGNTLLMATVGSEFKTFEIDRGMLTETLTLAGRPIHAPHLIDWDGPEPPRAIVLTAGGQLLAFGPIVEPPLVPLDPMPGNVVLLPETLDDVEPPLVPMIYPPGRLLPPETLPTIVVVKTSRPGPLAPGA